MTTATVLTTHNRIPFTALLSAHAASLTGNVMTLFVVPLYVLSAGGSIARVGIAGFCATLPVVLGGTLGGVLVDRIGYRTTSIFADLVGGAMIGAIPIMQSIWGLPFWLLLVLVFVGGLFDTPAQTARDALIPEMAASARIPLARAVAPFEAVERGTRLVGAPAAGFLLVWLGALPVLAIDAGTFLISAIVVALWVPKPNTVPTETTEGYWRELAEGFRFVFREKLLRTIVTLLLLTNMFDAAKSMVLLPLYANRHLGGAADLGLLVSAMGGGALAGSLMFGLIGYRFPRRALFVISFVLMAGPSYFALVAQVSFPWLIGIFVIAGIAAGAINPIIGTIKLERVPARLRARVYGAIGAGCTATTPLGSVVGAFGVAQIGLGSTLIVVGCLYTAAVLAPLFGKPWPVRR